MENRLPEGGVSDRTVRQQTLFPFSLSIPPAWKYRGQLGLTPEQEQEYWLSSRDGELGLGQQGEWAGATTQGRAHQDSDSFGQGPAGLEALLGILHRVLPLQPHCGEGPARGFLALGVEDEAACDLVLHRWPWGEGHTDFYSPPQEHEPHLGASRLSPWAPRALCLPVTPSPPGPIPSQMGHPTAPTQHHCLWTLVHTIPLTWSPLLSA